MAVEQGAKHSGERPDEAEEYAPPDALRAFWVAEGAVARDAEWTPLSGGRTNAVWRVTAPTGASQADDRVGGAPLVCKLFRAGGDTPLFRNDPEAEALALAALSDTGLAPEFVAAGRTPAGRSLVYAHVAGRPWKPGDDPAEVGRALARFHAETAPADLPELASGSAALRAQTREMLAGLGAEGAELAAQEPEGADVPPTPHPVFLHGDATAGNALVTPEGITFIDWQCPARGDAAEDLAIFLSPAMQATSGNPPLTEAQEEAVLAAYGDEETVARYRALEPLFHWRMAAYALWRAARGDAGYREAAELEIARLKGMSPRP